MDSYIKELDDLLVRYLINSCTEEESKAINSWLAENKENRLYFTQIKDIYFLGKTLKSPSGFFPEKSLNLIKYKYYKSRLAEQNNDFETDRTRRLNFQAIIAAAATVLLLVSLAFNFRSAFRSDDMVASNIPVVYNEISTPKGSRTQVTLPDGTIVWLNAGSNIKYPMDFFKGDRKVILTGEAFFEVKKYPKKKFIVNTSDIAIQVWGTKFNVKAYPEEDIIRTTLVEGSISITNLNGNLKEKEIYLSPNQTAIYYKGRENIESTDKTVDIPVARSAPRPVQIDNKVKTVLYTSWKDPKWIIEGQSLGDLALELERRYNVTIRFDNESVKKYRFNGILTNETFEQVMEIIKVSAPINFKIKSNQVLIKENLDSKTNYDRFLNR